jgi:aminoglycoside phosphotransferase (APT) family kinase protein
MSDLQTPDEQRLSLRIEDLTQGRVISMERQGRHRPAWFVEVERDGQQLHIYVRGDRDSDVQPFPELAREADILEILEAHGIPVPHIYGMSEDPPAIVMEAVRGTRDVAEAADDEERRRVARQYIEALVAMHRIPLEPFVEKGLTRPVGARQIALSGLDSYMPLYRRTKSSPQPLLEFAIKWLESNVPLHRDRASFVAFDAGQFLFDEGGLTALLDLEYSLIGDPMADLATMALREPIEPMGEEIGALCRYYAELVGEPLDIAAIRFQQVLFSTVGCMQFAGAIASPRAGDPHEVYLSWWIYLTRCLILSLSECIRIEPVDVDFPSPEKRACSPLIAMLQDSVRQIPAEGEAQRAGRRSALSLVAYQAEVDRNGPAVDRIACEEAESILGEKCTSRAELDARLEKFVASAAPEDDAALLEFFARDVERQRLAFHEAPLAQSADFARLVPI